MTLLRSTQFCQWLQDLMLSIQGSLIKNLFGLSAEAEIWVFPVTWRVRLGQGCFWNVWHWGRVLVPDGTACQTEGHPLVWPHRHTWCLLPISAALPAALRALLPSALGARLPASALSQQSFLLQDLPSLPVVFPVLPTLFLVGSREAEGKALAFLKDPVQLSLSLRVQGSLLSSWVCNASLFCGNGSYVITHFFCYMVHDINPML